jgi:hypothetical protein
VENAVKQFLARHAARITGVLSGFDRLVFRGTLLPLVRDRGMHVLLARAGLRLLDFKDYAQSVTERVREASLAEATRLERPIHYLPSASVNKEAMAQRISVQSPVERGLLCALTVVEPCMSFEYHRSPNPAERGLRLCPRKCLHIYKYYQHPVFGFMNARLETWFPFNVQICLNGREWLATEFARKGRTDFRRHDNCFLKLGNPALAQRWMDRQLETDWPRALDQIARSLNPLHEEIFRPYPMSYYWSAYQTEWATDVLFRDPGELAAIYPALTRHALLHLQSPDILRFLGRKVSGHFRGEITSSFKDRPEGVRVKHWVAGNSIKMYDKAGSVLRVETTIAQVRGFKVYRPLQDAPKGRLAWLDLRKGVADLHRRAEISQHANERYLEALATVDDQTPLHRVLDAVAKPVTHDGRRFRPLRIGDPDDLALLQAVSRGEFTPAGFRNRDLRPILYPSAPAGKSPDARRISARVSRKLRLLREHGIIQKISKTHRYRLTPRGQVLTAALSALRNATLASLVGTAA